MLALAERTAPAAPRTVAAALSALVFEDLGIIFFFFFFASAVVEEGKCVFISTKLYVILRRHVPKLLFVSLYSEVPVAHTRFDLVAVSSSQCIQVLQLISALGAGCFTTGQFWIH